MKIIRDPVHGDVEVSADLLPVLDSPAVQRLRMIRQLGFSFLVYPGAHHTRFEHSLGTMYLAAMMARQLSLSPRDTLLVTVSALLHDIGHGPFSHSSEPVLAEVAGITHQEIGPAVRDDPVLPSVLTRMGIDPEEVCRLVTGGHPLSGILIGDLDVDRMDYLLRDAHYTGAPYGTVDAYRLIRNTLATEEGLAIRESGINAAESLLIARTLMRPAVYFHHVSRIAEAMFLLAFREHIRGLPHEEVLSLLRSDDGACIEELRASPSPVTRELTNRIRERRLYKRALYAGRDQVNASALQACTGFIRERQVAAGIATAVGIPTHEVLVDIPPFPSPMSMGVQVKNAHEVLSLEELSPLVTTLNETRREQWRIGVYCPREHAPAVMAAASEILRIRPPTRQEKLPVS